MSGEFFKVGFLWQALKAKPNDGSNVKSLITA